MVKQLSGVECTGVEKSLAWAAVMRQLKKAGETGKLFKSGKAGQRAVQEAAEHFSHRAFNRLTLAERGGHSWEDCAVCAQSRRAQDIFGTAVVRYAPGAARLWPGHHRPHSCLCTRWHFDLFCVSVGFGGWVLGARARGATISPRFSRVLVETCVTNVCPHRARRWRRFPQGREAQGRRRSPPRGRICGSGR